MPYKSIAQERWAHTPNGEKALGGPSKVAEWDSASKGMKLPRKVKAPTPHAVRLASVLRRK
jgi:hypothetical protein